MAEHQEDDIGLDDLAEVAGLSVFHFTRMFADRMGMPPHRYLSQMRLERAKTLLALGRLSLAEISCACRFSSRDQLLSRLPAGDRNKPARLSNRGQALAGTIELVGREGCAWLGYCKAHMNGRWRWGRIAAHNPLHYWKSYIYYATLRTLRCI